MNEIANFNKIQITFAQFSDSKNNEINMDKLYALMKALKLLMSEMENEALQTPAGKRWLNGQFKIHTTVNHYYVELVNKDRMFFKSKEINELKIMFKKLINELELIIKSGKNRYITG